MIRSRLKRVAVVVGAGAVATMTTLAVNPFSASAAGSAATTTTLKAPASETNGHSATITAVVAAATSGSGRPTGTVTFTVTGSDAGTVACTGGNSVTLRHKDKAVCKIASGLLSSSASPYSVAASYSGDGTFAGSTAHASVAITAAVSRITLSYDAKPASKTATTFTATVTGGSGAAPTGTVTFVATATTGHAAKFKCSPGGRTQPLASNGDTPPSQVASCTLRSGWLLLKKTTKADPSPSTSWSVTASYNGDVNYLSSSTSLEGTVKSS
jgi:hypothetical protein